MSESHTNPQALALAKKIEDGAAIIAAQVAREIELRCGGNPEFEAIVLHAVERKIMTLRHAAQSRAAGIR